MAAAKKRIAILGGGPSGLFMYKRLLESESRDLEIAIFERKKQWGAGMPYSAEGANDEHITNVSGNEIPPLVTSVEEWVQTVPKELLKRFGLDPNRFNEYKVLPRLLFGEYLSAQFDLLQHRAKKRGIATQLHPGCTIVDIIDQPTQEEVWVEIAEMGVLKFDSVIICTGHHWPVRHEGRIPGYYDSPYPPAKLALSLNHPIAIRGSSLTAMDAIRTLARHNGTFHFNQTGKLSFQPADGSSEFKLVLHSKGGLLPAVRFHLENSHLSQKSLLSPQQLAEHIAGNDGFLSLDYIFDKDFKERFRERDAAFYERIKPMSLERFVDSMMALRERLEPFVLLRAEYAEAEKSIRRQESVYWKEMLAVLSFDMNYPAKYFSAEDMQRLQNVLMPLISIVIAFVPQRTCDELLALHEAGVLEIISVGENSYVEPESNGGITYHYTEDAMQMQSVPYQTFVDCVGQPHLSYEQFPFKTLVANRTVSPARLKFQSAQEGEMAKKKGKQVVEQDTQGAYYLRVPGIAINDNFQVVDEYGAYNSRIFNMAVPYMGGYNPDYSGLDFCEEASARISQCLFSHHVTEPQA